MAKTEFIRARIDTDLKNKAASVLDEMGLTTSDAVRILLTRIAKTGSFPLELIPNVQVPTKLRQPAIPADIRPGDGRSMASRLRRSAPAEPVREHTPPSPPPTRETAAAPAPGVPATAQDSMDPLAGQDALQPDESVADWFARFKSRTW